MNWEKHEIKALFFTAEKLKIETADRVSYLSFIQKLACKWLKIEPAEKFLYSLKISTKPFGILRAGDIISATDGNKWFVISSYKQLNVAIIKNLYPIRETSWFSPDMVITSQSFKEGS